MSAAPVVPIRRPLSRVEAEHLTDRIRSAAEELWQLLLEAHDCRAWAALGYPSWSAYISTEFDFSRSYAYRLLDQGRVIQGLREAVSPNGDTPAPADIVVSEAEARDLKPVLAVVTDAITEATRDVPPERLGEVVRRVIAHARRKATQPDKPKRTREYTVPVPTAEWYAAEAERLEAEARTASPYLRKKKDERAAAWEEVDRLHHVEDLAYWEARAANAAVWDAAFHGAPAGDVDALRWDARKRDALRIEARKARADAVNLASRLEEWVRRRPHYPTYDRPAADAWVAQACAWQLQRREILAAPPPARPDADSQRRLRELWQACHEQAGHDPVGTKLLLRAALEAARGRLAEQPEGTVR